MASETKQEVQVTSKGKDIAHVPARSLRPLAELDRMFDRLMGRGWLSPFSWGGPLWSDWAETMEARMPNIDVIDRDNEVVVRAEVPGVDKKDLDVSLSDNVLTLKGRTQREEKEEKGDYHRCEISRTAFARSVTLPAAVDASKVSAALKDGVLEITLPKLEGAKRRSIAVQ